MSGSKRIEWVVNEVFCNRIDSPSPILAPDRLRYNKDTEFCQLISKVFENSYVCLTACDRCYVVERPLLVATNDRGFHCDTGPAILFRDGTEIYCYEGILVEKDNVLNPENITLDDIKKYSSKHILIDLCGVDHYLDMVKNWKPDAKGKLSKFFSFKGAEYKRNLVISTGPVNDEWSLKFDCNNCNLYSFPLKNNLSVFDFSYHKKIFSEEDRGFWDSLNIKEMFSRMLGSNLNINFHDGYCIFQENKSRSKCYYDVAPAWFKAKMFREQEAFYDAGDYAVKYENGELSYSGNISVSATRKKSEETDDKIYCFSPLFAGSLPYYEFDIHLTDTTWEGLLEQWQTLSFNWLEMFEDSTKLSCQ